MSENKCCGNCKHFKNEDTEGVGFCPIRNMRLQCGRMCQLHEYRNNGWTEITQDNVDSIYDEALPRVIVTDGKEYKPALDWGMSLSTMAKSGGYWFYLVPKFEKEG